MMIKGLTYITLIVFLNSCGYSLDFKNGQRVKRIISYGDRDELHFTSDTYQELEESTVVYVKSGKYKVGDIVKL